MNRSELRTKVLQEIQHIPENRLVELYNLIHAFRLQVDLVNAQPQSILDFAGCWSDLPDETYTEFFGDISFRRQQAFSQRQHRETSPD